MARKTAAEEKGSGISGGHGEEWSLFCRYSTPGSPAYCSRAEQGYSLWDSAIMSKKQERNLTLLLFNSGIGDVTIKKKSFHLPEKNWLCSGQSFLPGAFLETTSVPWVTSQSLLEPGKAVRVPSISEGGMVGCIFVPDN